MTFISYAQNGEDVILWRALKHIENGFYIDVGACDPDELSVTKAFYERGWHGVNIEPVREYYELCVKKRPRDKNINVAVTARSGISHFMTVKGTGLSTTVDVFATKAADKGWDVEAQDVLALSLADICTSLSLHEVHFLKIDVEGAERAVLEGADFEQVRPWIVVVEATTPLSTERSEHLWEHILLQAGYQRAFFDGLNLYYVAQEHSELIETLAAPPNALDDFKPVRMAEAEERIAHLNSELEAQHRGHEELIAHLKLELEAQNRRREDLQTQLEALGLEHTAQIATASAQAEVQALEMERQAEAFRAELAQRDGKISDLLSDRAHQELSAAQRQDFTSRKLAQSRRKVIELEERLHAQQHSLDSLAALVPILRTELEAQTARLGELEDQAAEKIGVLSAQNKMLATENDRLQKHRDAILQSTSWRISAPLRKTKTAFRIVRSQPHLVFPLVAENFRRRPRPVPELVAAPTMPDPPSISRQEDFETSLINTHHPTEIQPSTSLARRDRMIMSIRDGIGKRRLLSQ
jgi:FkbM family methyltransferase